MKHFLIEITYTASPDRIEAVAPAHREYLQTGYDSGMLLYSGPKNPRTGGIVLARANDQSEIDAFFALDPYHLHGVAEHRFVEFLPLKHQTWLSEWVSGN